MTKVNILVETEVRDDLKRIGKMGDTYSDVVSHLVLMYKEVNTYEGDEQQ